jgi:hypothetical protein
MKRVILQKLKLKVILGIMVFSFLVVSSQTLASTTNGTIDPSYRYAWGENVGWVDFGSETGDVHITDDGLSGYAYGENIGWINLADVANDKEGNLSGYAWGENVGFIDFSKVSIDNHGYFSGSAYGENIGWITFDKDGANNVTTDWRPESSRSHYSSGSSPAVIAEFQQKQQALQTTPSTESPTDQTENPVITRILKLTTPMMKGDDVKSLQTYLNSHLYNCGLADGIFGKLTKQAVISFQLANQLVGDGIVGPLTRALLK